MDLKELEKKVRELSDRQEIRDVVMRYSRGVDRLDKELLLSCYHPDAIDDHGIFMGTAAEFVAWVIPLHTQYQNVTQHCITNHLCELDGDVAHTESYYLYASMNTGKPPLTVCGGRYLDRFERRNGEWRIATRMSLFEWYGTPGEVFVGREKIDKDDHDHESRRDRTDPSYHRPLTIKKKTAAYRIVPLA